MTMVKDTQTFLVTDRGHIVKARWYESATGKENLRYMDL